MEFQPAINLSGGGSWADLDTDHGLRTWDQRDHEPLHAGIFDRERECVPVSNANSSLHFRYANVGSWQKHGRTLQNDEPEITIAVETKMSKTVWEGQALSLQAQGYTAVVARIME